MEVYNHNVLISYKVYLLPSQNVGVKTNYVFQNLRVFNHTASILLSGTNHTLLVNVSTNK